MTRVPGRWEPTGRTQAVALFVCELGHEMRHACGSNAEGTRGTFCGHDINREGTRCHAPAKHVVRTEPETRWVPGYVIVRCSCGAEVTCTEFTNACGCGADYNHGGSRLAARQFWGEETGETWSECWG